MGCTITNDKNRNKLRYMSKQLVSQTKTQNKKHKQCEFYWILSEANGTYKLIEHQKWWTHNWRAEISADNEGTTTESFSSSE